MLAPKSTHKRKRSSARSDKARKLGPARWIVNLLPSDSSTSPLESGAESHSHAHAEPSRDRRLDRLVDAHPFNRSLELILPLVTEASDESADSSAELPPLVRSLIAKVEQIASSHRSYRARIPLSLLLDPIFVTAYIRTGSLIALSDVAGAPGLSPHLDDSVCIDGQGTLVLSLCKDTYQTLGLTGRASHFSRLASGRAADRTSGPDSRFIVELPLLSPSFVPGKKGYQQALERLRQWDRSRTQALTTEQTMAQSHASSKMASSIQAADPVTSEHATWDMLFVWSPSRATAEAIAASSSSSSLSGSIDEIRFPEELVRPEDVECLTLPPCDPIVTDSVWVPALHDPAQHPLASTWRENQRHFTDLEPRSDDPATTTWSTFQDGLQEAVEWAGLASLGATPIRTFTRPDATCVYSPPSPSQPGRIVKLGWSGTSAQPLLLSPLFISQIAAEVDRLVAESSRKVPSNRATEKAQWATLSCSGFPHAPLTWRAKVPYSSLYGAKELPDNKTSLAATATAAAQAATEDVSMTDASSSDDEEEDADSDSSLDMDGLRAPKRKTKKRSKRSIGKNQTEHTFTPATGETGWISFSLGASRPRSDAKQAAPRSGRWVFVELIGTDTRS